jgi:hypothetical protein
MNIPKRAMILVTLSAFIFSSLVAIVPVSALEGCKIPDKTNPKICLDNYFSSNNILFYDPNAEECIEPTTTGGPNGTNGTTTQMFGNDNAEKIFSYLIGKGLSGQQAAGILGNFQQESGFDPAIRQGGAIAEPNFNPINGEGFGIAQWTFDARQVPLENLAKSSGRKTTDLALQLDFLWQELNSTHKSSLDSLKAESTPERAAYVFHRDFEGSADSEATVIQVRGGNASALYEKYKVLAPASSASTTSATSGLVCKPTSSSSSTGVSDFLSSNFSTYDQCADPWGDRKTPRGETVCKDGSIPIALAIIAQNITGRSVPPNDVIDYYTSHGLWLASGGSLLSSPSVAAGEFGLRVAPAANKGDIKSYKTVFDKGGLIMAISTGSAPFTSNRHAIVLRGITDNNEFKIADPNPPDSIIPQSDTFSTDKILTDIRADEGSVVYAFYKR